MKKNIFGTLLLSAIVFSAVGTTASAVETSDGKSVEESEVEVKLTKPKGYDDGSGPFKDKLAIVHKPKAYQFEGETTTGSLNLANKNKNKDTQFITVNDDRTDTTDSTKWAMGKWALTGKLSELKTADGSQTLTAKMNFTTDKLYQYAIGALETKASGQEDYAPAPVSDNLVEVSGSNYTLAKTFTLPADGQTEATFLQATTAAPFAKADANDVKGVTTNLGNANLIVENGNAVDSKAGNYKGVITWTLSAQ